MPHQIQLQRRIAASPEEVYEAWTDPASLSEWLVPIAGGRSEARGDPRVGGTYHVDMFGDGVVHPHHGEYLRLVPHSLVEFTWISHATQQQRSVVTVELKAAGPDQTDLTLTHRLLPSEAAASDHTGGWTAGLDRLVAWARLPADRRGASYRRRLELAAPVATVYRALTTPEGLRGWWTQTSETGTREADAIDVHFGPVWKRMRIERLVADRTVRWHCVDANLIAAGVRDPREWVDTSLIFRLVAVAPDRCTLHFEHLGLTPAVDCYAICSAGWEQFLGSLRRYVETGTGAPYIPAPQAAA